MAVMSQHDHAPVERLYVRLNEALQRSRRDPYDAPVTVAEIYQELIPYRLVRTEAGFDMNADYEHALLRLLAGEGERVRLEPAHVAEELQRELRSANPNLSAYRSYAACDAWVARPEHVASLAEQSPSHEAAGTPTAETSDWQMMSEMRDTPAPEAATAGRGRFALAEESAGRGAEAAPATPPEVVREAAPARAGGRSPEVVREAAPSRAAGRSPEVVGEAAPAKPAGPPSETPPVREPAVADAARAESARCAYCDSTLPAQRPARFCPYCGADQTTRPCTACGEVIEPGWVFCIACGASAQ